VIIAQPVIHAGERRNQRQCYRPRKRRVATLDAGETDCEALRKALALLALPLLLHVLPVEVLLCAFLRRIGLVRAADETVDLLVAQLVGELRSELLNGADAEQQREEIERESTASDGDTVLLGVPLDCITIDLEAVLVLENPFARMEWILSGVKQKRSTIGLAYSQSS
jgi:hypothetical protein